MLVCDTFQHDSVYCNEHKVDGVRTYVAINPQPAPSDVITVTRYYGTSNLHPSFKKRVSWLVNNDGPSDAAVVEYKGMQPDVMVHGNASKTKRPYVQMPTETIDHVAAAVITAPPKSMYSNCLMNDVSDHGTLQLQSSQRQETQLAAETTEEESNCPSTDGMLTVNTPSKKGQKPNQWKRPAAEKTTSAAKRQR